jgi:hypothetical protein
MGVSVDGSEAVPEARRHLQRSYQVNMHMRETCRREVETPERGFHVPRYLGSLAGSTSTCPYAAVFPRSRPHKTLGHQLDGGVGPGVVGAVEDVKNLLSERCGYDWPRLWSGCVRVKVDVCPGNVHPFQTKDRTIFQDVLQLRILILRIRKSMVINRCRDRVRYR